MAEALGMIETRGFAAMVEAADAMVKAAKVELVSLREDRRRIRDRGRSRRRGGGEGRGRRRLTRPPTKVGEVVATHVIARPHTNVDIVLPLGRAEEAHGRDGRD